MKKVNELFVKCDCSTEGMLLTHYEEDKQIYVVLYGIGIEYNNKPNFWQRLKYAIFHLRTGKKVNDSIILTYDNAKKISNWIKKEINE